MAKYLSANEAAALLGIHVRSLYAYVSRGRIRSVAGDHPHKRGYDAEDVDEIVRRKGIGRRTDRISTSTLRWGHPVLETSITEIAKGKLLYRGQAAAELAAQATLEDVSRILWDTGNVDPFSAPFDQDYFIASLKQLDLVLKRRGLPTSRAVAPLSLVSFDFKPILGRAPSALWSEGVALMRLIVSAMTGSPYSSPPIHLQLGKAWKLDKEKADLVRRALVVCADHELNASTFSTRIIASTGASLSSCLIGGLEAMSGPRHGSATLRLQKWLDEIGNGKKLLQKIQSQIDRGEMVPGFGHPIYPEGNPRAKAILDHLPAVKRRDDIIEAVFRITGKKPNIDFGLVSLQQALKLPPDSALTLFAIGRSAGWIAHAIEQNETGTLIRPRAVFLPKY